MAKIISWQDYNDKGNTDFGIVVLFLSLPLNHNRVWNKARSKKNEYSEAALAWRSNTVLWRSTHFSTLLFLVWFVQQGFSPPLSRTHLINLPLDAHLSTHHSESKPFIVLFKHPPRPWEDGGNWGENAEKSTFPVALTLVINYRGCEHPSGKHLKLLPLFSSLPQEL